MPKQRHRCICTRYGSRVKQIAGIKHDSCRSYIWSIHNGFQQQWVLLGYRESKYKRIEFCKLYVSESSKIFDVVTWTGDGASSKQIAHNLGGTIGAVIVKRIDTTSDWPTWVRNSLPPGNYSSFTSGGRGLNSSSAALNTNESGYNSAFTSSTLNVGTGGNVGIGPRGLQHKWWFIRRLPIR